MNKEQYAEYLQSDQWEEFRRQYITSRPPDKQGCVICGTRYGRELHHVTYERVGREKFEDIRLVCGNHHEEIHAALKAKGWGVRKSDLIIRELMGLPALPVVPKKVKPPHQPTPPSAEKLARRAAQKAAKKARKEARRADRALRFPPKKVNQPVAKIVRKVVTDPVAKMTMAMLRSNARRSPTSRAQPLEDHDERRVRITGDMLVAARTIHGGYTRDQMALIGVPWPPRKGWKDRVVGKWIDPETYEKFVSFGRGV